MSAFYHYVFLSPLCQRHMLLYIYIKKPTSVKTFPQQLYTCINISDTDTISEHLSIADIAKA